MNTAPPILYCRCAYAKTVPEDVKNEVLCRLAASDTSFDTVPDLCEMSARKDPVLQSLAKQSSLKIVACYPRAVKWLFNAAGAPLNPEQVQVLNMRTQSAEEIAAAVLDGEFRAQGGDAS